MKLKIKTIFYVFCCLCCSWVSCAQAGVKSGTSFSEFDDINWDEVQLSISGICICVKGWEVEVGSMWQNDELAAIIEPEATMFATIAMQLTCMADAASTNLGTPIDAMPWCIGSSGSSYPLTGHVDNDNIVQASNTVAARMIYKLCRLFMICDPANSYCAGSCTYTPVWIKSHYKMYAVRPSRTTTAHPVGISSKWYDSGLNPPFM